jgi:hypothetical protein
MVWTEHVAISSLLLCNCAKSLFSHVYYTQDFGICILILNDFTWGRGCLKISVTKCYKYVYIFNAVTVLIVF